MLFYGTLKFFAKNKNHAVDKNGKSSMSTSKFKAQTPTPWYQHVLENHIEIRHLANKIKAFLMLAT